MFRCDDPRQRRRHFWPQRHRAFAFVPEFVQLPHDFVAGFFFVEIEFFQHWSVEFHEPVTRRDLAPFCKNVTSCRAASGKKIAEPSKRLHTDSKTKGNHWGVARGEASADTGLYEPSLRLNKTRPGPVEISHDGKHPFNKAKDKHERQQIKQNV